MSDCLLMLRNERWKRVRSILTPSFSAAKMKEVRYPLFNYQKGVGHDPNAPCTQDSLNRPLSVFLSTLSHAHSKRSNLKYSFPQCLLHVCFKNSPHVDLLLTSKSSYCPSTVCIYWYFSLQRLLASCIVLGCFISLWNHIDLFLIVVVTG